MKGPGRAFRALLTLYAVMAAGLGGMVGPETHLWREGYVIGFVVATAIYVTVESIAARLDNPSS